MVKMDLVLCIQTEFPENMIMNKERIRPGRPESGHTNPRNVFERKTAGEARRNQPAKAGTSFAVVRFISHLHELKCCIFSKISRCRKKCKRISAEEVDYFRFQADIIWSS